MFTVGGAHIIVEVIYIINDVILFSSNRSQTKNQIGSSIELISLKAKVDIHEWFTKLSN